MACSLRASGEIFLVSFKEFTLPHLFLYLCEKEQDAVSCNLDVFFVPWERGNNGQYCCRSSGKGRLTICSVYEIHRAVAED